MMLQEGLLSSRGDRYPIVFEEVPAVARFLTAATLVGEYPGKVVDETENAVPMEHEWPAIYTFGGDDTARFSSDDLRRLELHGLAAEYVFILEGLGILFRIYFFVFCLLFFLSYTYYFALR